MHVQEHVHLQVHVRAHPLERRWLPSGLIARPVIRSVCPVSLRSSTASSLFMRRSHRLYVSCRDRKGGCDRNRDSIRGVEGFKG